MGNCTSSSDDPRPNDVQASTPLLSTLESVMSLAQNPLGDAWRVVPRHAEPSKPGGGGPQPLLFLGPSGFCVVQPDGRKSHATCSATLEALAGIRRGTDLEPPTFDDLPTQPTLDTVRRLQTAVEQQMPNIELLAAGLRAGKLNELEAARELLDLIGSYELRIAVFRAIGNANAALLRARHHKALTHESSARSFRMSGRMPSARGIERKESMLLSARGFERGESISHIALLGPQPDDSMGECSVKLDTSRVPTPPPPASPAPTPPPTPYACGSHEGGAGGRGKENQDTYFVAQPLPDVAVFAVFDGHGKQNGQLAAHVASAVIKEHLCANAARLLTHPREVLFASFAAAHVAIGRAMMERATDMRWVSSPTPITPRAASRTAATRLAEAAGLRSDDFVARGGFPMELVEDPEDDDSPYWDAADGGTTATIAVVLRGTKLILATVGDSSAVILGRKADGGGASGMLIVEEHGATNAQEYMRLHAALPPGQDVRFVYECPDGEMIDIFAVNADGNATLDTNAVFEADQHECAVKTSRGDLVSVILVPERTVELPGKGISMVGAPAAKPKGRPGKWGFKGSSRMNSQSSLPCGTSRHNSSTGFSNRRFNSFSKRRGKRSAPVAACITCCEQGIAMTRSLGDFYAHTFGITWEPEIVTINLTDVAEESGLEEAALLLASDGIWDLWEFDQVAEALLPPVGSAPVGGDEAPAGGAALCVTGDAALAARLGIFCEKTRAMGESLFGESADNLTGVLIRLPTKR